MFESWTAFRHIVVTGPQRSGTRIGAKAIAHDTGYEYIDETTLHTDGFYHLYAALKGAPDGGVFQCPALCRVIHAIRGFKDVLVVMMMRPLEEIQASMDRIGWSWAELEMDLYADATREQPSVAGRKYAHWHFTQKRLLPNTHELKYHDLEEHPLWVAQGDRRDERGEYWGYNQTEVVREVQT